MSAKLERQAAYESGVRALFHRQLREHPPTPPTGQPLSQQTIIITGSNGGLGYESAKQILQLGPSKLIMAVRSITKGEAAASQLRAEIGESQACTIEVWELDMQSYDSIRAFTKRCNTQLDRIDIVLHNAGLRTPRFTRDPQTGHESTLQVNYFGTALFCALLVPILKSKKSATSDKSTPRLCCVASDTVYLAKLDLTKPLVEQVDDEKAFSPMDWYPKTKLMLLMFITELAKRVDSSDIIINCTNPGMTKGTGFNTDTGNPLINTVAGGVLRVLGRDVPTGASAYVDSVVVQGRESHGSFTSDWTIKAYPPSLYTKQGQQASRDLWDITVKELGISL